MRRWYHAGISSPLFLSAGYEHTVGLASQPTGSDLQPSGSFGTHMLIPRCARMKRMKAERWRQVEQLCEIKKVITPMVAKLVKEPFDREGWIFELRFRAIAETEPRKSSLVLAPRSVRPPSQFRLCFEHDRQNTRL